VIWQLLLLILALFIALWLLIYVLAATPVAVDFVALNMLLLLLLWRLLAYVC
jgi:hypothetical protein